jgi:hypothetical protein
MKEIRENIFEFMFGYHKLKYYISHRVNTLQLKKLIGIFHRKYKVLDILKFKIFLIFLFCLVKVAFKGDCHLCIKC